jgi:hypothetical protein
MDDGWIYDGWMGGWMMGGWADGLWGGWRVGWMDVYIIVSNHTIMSLSNQWMDG